MSSDGLNEIIDADNAFLGGGYYSIAATTIFFYDFFLTLPDEIKYAWHGRKSWVFAIFLANRYLPIGYQIWTLYTRFNGPFFQRLYYGTVFLDFLAYVVSTLLAQVVLTLRIYAVTRKNRVITSCFCAIMIAQLILGIYLIVYTATREAQPILLPVLIGRVLVGYESLEIGLLAISVIYDLLAFSLIVYLVVRSNVNKVPIPRLFKTIARDATYYFLFIFTSHLMVVLFLLFASPNLKNLPATPTIAYIPVMITRLMLSLKKTSASQEYGWSLGEATVHTTMRFAERRGGVVPRDEIRLIRLDTFASTHEGTRSWE